MARTDARAGCAAWSRRRNSRYTRQHRQQRRHEERRQRAPRQRRQIEPRRGAEQQRRHEDHERRVAEHARGVAFAEPALAAGPPADADDDEHRQQLGQHEPRHGASRAAAASALGALARAGLLGCALLRRRLLRRGLGRGFGSRGQPPSSPPSSWPTLWRGASTSAAPAAPLFGGAPLAAPRCGRGSNSKITLPSFLSQARNALNLRRVLFETKFSSRSVLPVASSLRHLLARDRLLQDDLAALEVAGRRVGARRRARRRSCVPCSNTRPPHFGQGPSGSWSLKSTGSPVRRRACRPRRSRTRASSS